MEKNLDAIVQGFDPEATIVIMPTNVGAHGIDGIRFLYQHYSLTSFPKDMERRPVTLTSGIGNTLVDESVLKFTHNVECHEFLPGVHPTGKIIEVPVIYIVTFADAKPGTVLGGVRIQNLRIYFDQSLVLTQVLPSGQTDIPWIGRTPLLY